MVSGTVSAGASIAKLGIIAVFWTQIRALYALEGQSISVSHHETDKLA